MVMVVLDLKIGLCSIFLGLLGFASKKIGTQLRRHSNNTWYSGGLQSVTQTVHSKHIFNASGSFVQPEE
jgi:hypothetical protein